MGALLGAVARYARDSRWVGISRTSFAESHVLAEQTRVLGALEDEELRALAAECAPTLSPREVEPFLRPAAGSPWRLRRLLAGDSAPPTSGDRAIWDGLVEPVRSFVATLCALRVPLPLLHRAAGVRRLAPVGPHLPG